MYNCMQQPVLIDHAARAIHNPITHANLQLQTLLLVRRIAVNLAQFQVRNTQVAQNQAHCYIPAAQ